MPEVTVAKLSFGYSVRQIASSSETAIKSLEKLKTSAKGFMDIISGSELTTAIKLFDDFGDSIANASKGAKELYENLKKVKTVKVKIPSDFTTSIKRFGEFSKSVSSASKDAKTLYENIKKVKTVKVKLPTVTKEQEPAPPAPKEQKTVPPATHATEASRQSDSGAAAQLATLRETRSEWEKVLSVVGKVGGTVGGVVVGALNTVGGILGRIVKKVERLLKSVTRIGMYRTIRLVLKDFGQLVDVGLQSIYEFSKRNGTSFATQMDKIRSSVVYLGDTASTVLASVIENYGDKIAEFIDKVARALDFVAALVAYLSGADTYYSAIKGMHSFYEETTAAANAMRDLLGFDEINRLNGGRNGSGSVAIRPGDFMLASVFERLNIPADLDRHIGANLIGERIGNGIADGIESVVESGVFRRIAGSIGLAFVRGILEAIGDRIAKGIVEKLDKAFSDISSFFTLAKMKIELKLYEVAFKINATITGILAVFSSVFSALGMGDISQSVYDTAEEYFARAKHFQGKTDAEKLLELAAKNAYTGKWDDSTSIYSFAPIGQVDAPPAPVYVSVNVDGETIVRTVEGKFIERQTSWGNRAYSEVDE